MASAIKFIPSDEVYRLIDLNDLLERLECAFGNFSKGTGGGVTQPVRSVIPVDNHHGFMATMPGYSQYDNALATKIVAFYPENKDHPSHQAWVMLLNPVNGSLQAIIDGESVTAIRTGIASAVATKHLANPNSKILAILGTGTQARSHYKAMNLIQNFDEVRVWGVTPAHAQKLASEIKAKCCHTAEEAVRGADIICTVTFATTPLIEASWVKEGAHINAVGACRPEWQELSSEIMNKAVVYCDSREACAKESGDIILSECEVYAEIGEVVNGEKEAKWQQTTVFKSVGIAIEDVVSAKIVFDKYMQQNAP